MRDLIKQEQFELEVLDKLNGKKLLHNLVFTGGTMLRLCHNLNRYSVDLDFWVIKEIDYGAFFSILEEYLSKYYVLKDAAHKFNTLLFEMRGKGYPRSLKIEIRKEAKKIATEQAIAYSPHSTVQVLLTVPTLVEMMNAKVEAFLSRKEIRDVFDMEFMLKKGVPVAAGKEKLGRVLDGINLLKRNDYAVKLGLLLDEGQRKYYNTENFKILKSALSEALGRT